MPVAGAQVISPPSLSSHGGQISIQKGVSSSSAPLVCLWEQVNPSGSWYQKEKTSKGRKDEIFFLKSSKEAEYGTLPTHRHGPTHMSSRVPT